MPLRRNLVPLLRIVLLVITLLLGASSSQAQLFNVSIDTSGLNPGSTYGIEFQLNQGDALNPVSTVNIGSFSTVGGTAPNPATIPTFSFGNYSGDLSNTVTLSTGGGSAFNYFSEDYQPGSSLSFSLDLSGFSSQDPFAAAPDQFIFSFYDETANAPVATYDGLLNPRPGNELFTVTRGPGGVYSTQTFGYQDSNGTVFNANSSGNPAAAPELSTVVSFGGLLVLMGVGLLMKKRAKSPRAIVTAI
ncbi:MAG TPA: hypothetical protein VGK19_04190 [Capsulimonadaceae bacterium]